VIPEATKQFNPVDHLPALKKLIAETNISIGDLKRVGKKLGISEKEAHKVLGALASTRDAPIFQTKGRPAVRNKMGRIVKKAVQSRFQRIARRTKPMHLMEFVRAIGGVRSDNHNLRNVGNIARYPGVINNKSRMGVDDLGVALWEAGYTAKDERPSEQEVLNLLEEGSHKRIYARGGQTSEDIDQREREAGEGEEQYHRDELQAVAESHDLDLTPKISTARLSSLQRAKRTSMQSKQPFTSPPLSILPRARIRPATTITRSTPMTSMKATKRKSAITALSKLSLDKKASPELRKNALRTAGNLRKLQAAQE
jgi:hypothetical protein